jgi:hypothetical protein
MDHRSEAWKATGGIMAAGATDASLEPRSEARCKICSASERDLPNGAAVRNLVDELLLIPRDYSAIMRTVAPLTAGWPEELQFSRFALMRHARRHLRWEQAAFRAVADRRSRHQAKMDGASERMINAVVVYETIRQRGLDLLMQGEIKPSVKDMLAATSALQAIEDEDNAAISPALFHSQLNRVIQVIREEIPEDRWASVVARLEGDDDAVPLPQSEPDPVWEELMAEASELS